MAILSCHAFHWRGFLRQMTAIYLPELEKVVWLKVTKTALVGSMCCVTFSTELVFADGLPSSSSGVVQSSLQCVFFPTFLLKTWTCISLVWMVLHYKQSPFALCCRFLLISEGRRKGLDVGGCSDVTPVSAQLSSEINTAFCTSSSQKWPSEVTSSNVSLKGVLSSVWDGVYCDIIGWVSEAVEDAHFVPFSAMPCRTTPLVNKILLMSSLNIYTLNF